MFFIFNWLLNSFLPSRIITYEDCSYDIDDACDVVLTGDIVLISGTSTSSHFVTLFCASEYSHIGIIFRDPANQNKPFLFESIRHNDDTSGSVHAIPTSESTGVKLTDFREFLEKFKGNSVSIRKITIPHNLGLSTIKDLQIHLQATIGSVVAELLNRPYEQNYIEFIIARYPIFEFKREDSMSSVFCSELVAYCLLKAGLLLCKPYEACKYLPDDFSDTGGIHLAFPKEFMTIPLIHYTSPNKIIQLSNEEFIATKKIQDEYIKQQQLIHSSSSFSSSSSSSSYYLYQQQQLNNKNKKKISYFTLFCFLIFLTITICLYSFL